MEETSDNLINELLSDRSKFNDFVYTPLSLALKEIKDRQDDKDLDEKVRDMLGNYIPSIFKNKKPKGVLFRQIATPNYESLRFISILDTIKELDLLFLEYLDDKFVSNNEFKRFLGRLFFFHGQGKTGTHITDSFNIIDFNKYNGKRISDIYTVNNHKLADFHRKLFSKQKVAVEEDWFYDASDWFSHYQGGAKGYYESYLLYFIRNGVLFENFMLENEHELDFIKNVFLPIFIRITKSLGKKPLIIPLEPTEIEGEKFWSYYPGSLKLDIIET